NTNNNTNSDHPLDTHIHLRPQEKGSRLRLWLAAERLKSACHRQSLARHPPSDWPRGLSARTTDTKGAWVPAESATTSVEPVGTRTVWAGPGYGQVPPVRRYMACAAAINGLVGAVFLGKNDSPTERVQRPCRQTRFAKLSLPERTPFLPYAPGIPVTPNFVCPGKPRTRKALSCTAPIDVANSLTYDWPTPPSRAKAAWPMVCSQAAATKPSALSRLLSAATCRGGPKLPR